MMRVVSAVLMVVFAALCLACGGAGAPGTARKVGEPKSDAVEVAADFAADTGAATKVYRGRELEVSGEVVSASRAERNSSGPNLAVKIDGAVSCLCFWTTRTAAEGDAVLALKKGERVKVRGKVLNATVFAAEGKVALSLDDCALVK